MATLAPGTKLGPHEIVEPLGAGGMGQVYRARDTRLERSVAIKVLPDHLSKDAELRERFEREAKVISNLNHPHICTLHDVGHENGVDYLVLELIEGETLADRLQRGALPLDEALRYGAQIADALAKAHRAGVVHRDLKPGNIMLTSTGAKLLDFGLAAFASETEPGSGSDLSSLPTAHKALTEKGTVLGTFQYMSPEQVEGASVDARTDIFALGVVLYEMVTGEKAFEGSSGAKLMASILEREIAPVSPPALDHVIRRSVEKAPEARWQNAQDVAGELQWIREGGYPETSVAAPRVRGAAIAWALFGVAALAATALAARLLTTPTPTKEVVRFTISETDELRFVQVLGVPVMHAVSPDGRYVAFVGIPAGEGPGLWVRPLDSLEARKLGTGFGLMPFWSPDGRFVVGVEGPGGRLMKVGIDGSPPQSLGEIAFRGGTWNARDVILAGTESGGLVRLSPLGGESTPVTELAAGEGSHRWPHFLPDGDHFLYTVDGSSEAGGIHVGSLDGGTGKRLLNDVSKAEYVEPGYLLFSRDGALMAQPFDASALELSGQPVPLAESVAVGALTGYYTFSASRNGTLAYHPGSQAQELAIYDRAGRRTVIDQPGRYRSPVLSPDGRKIAVERTEGDTLPDIWVIDLDRGTNSRLTFHPGIDWYPLWSPDGEDILFASNRGGTHALYRKRANGTGDAELLLETEENLYPTDWSRDGRYILYASGPVGGAGRDVWALPLFGDGEPMRVLDTEFIEWRAAFSPDGKWITYNSNESGRQDVYIQSFPPSGAKWQISTTGGNMPRFSADGSEVTYVTAEGQLQRVAISGGEDLQAGPQELLFSIDGFTGPNLRYAVSPDGETFVFPSSPPSIGGSELHVVLNWPELLDATER